MINVQCVYHIIHMWQIYKKKGKSLMNKEKRWKVYYRAS